MTTPNQNHSASPRRSVAWTASMYPRVSVEAAYIEDRGFPSRDVGYQHSITSPATFWESIIDFLAIPFIRRGALTVNQAGHMSEARWFAGSQINLAHSCLAKWEGSTDFALVEEGEDGSVTQWTGQELCNAVQRGASVLRDVGITRGDRVALLLPMSAPGVISLLSVAWAGAVAVPIFSGFGVEATNLRIHDSGAKAVVTQSMLTRRGRPVDLLAVAREASEGTSAAGRLLVWADEAGSGAEQAEIDWHARAATIPPMLSPVATESEDAALIAYTSGTTGKPKGVVHTHGGLTVKLAQEAAFQLDVQPGDKVSWVTDLGWIMSYWITVGALVNRATLFCYPGAPDFPNPDRILSFAQSHELTALGLSPSLIRGMMTALSPDHSPAELPRLLAFGSSGEPWTEDAWWWLFESVGRGCIPIINFTGGTEVGACFLSANLSQGLKPLSVGEPCWGMAVEDWGADGTPNSGEAGELVCTQSWPSMARSVWGDHQRFLSTYFDTWPNVWRHGDRVSYDADGFWTLHGRSDDVMNVAGKRLGPVEVEAAALSVGGITQAAAVGIPHPTKGESVALFLVLSENHSGNSVPEDIADSVRTAVVDALGKAFAPSHIVSVPGLPRTRTAKTVRRAIRSAALGESPGDLSTVENPAILEHFPILTAHNIL